VRTRDCARRCSEWWSIDPRFVMFGSRHGHGRRSTSFRRRLPGYMRIRSLSTTMPTRSLPHAIMILDKILTPSLSPFCSVSLPLQLRSKTMVCCHRRLLEILLPLLVFQYRTTVATFREEVGRVCIEQHRPSRTMILLPLSIRHNTSCCPCHHRNPFFLVKPLPKK
jgi:hypothetical protein